MSEKVKNHWLMHLRVFEYLPLLIEYDVHNR